MISFRTCLQSSERLQTPCQLRTTPRIEETELIAKPTPDRVTTDKTFLRKDPGDAGSRRRIAKRAGNLILCQHATNVGYRVRIVQSRYQLKGSATSRTPSAYQRAINRNPVPRSGSLSLTLSCSVAATESSKPCPTGPKRQPRLYWRASPGDVEADLRLVSGVPVATAQTIPTLLQYLRLQTLRLNRPHFPIFLVDKLLRLERCHITEII